MPLATSAGIVVKQGETVRITASRGEFSELFSRLKEDDFVILFFKLAESVPRNHLLCIATIKELYLMRKKMLKSPWNNRKAAYLGDSITDQIHVGTTKNYWQFLEEELGITPFVYGINGSCWDSIPDQAAALYREHGTDVDAIFIFIGTNDYKVAVAPGKWFTYAEETVNSGGVMVTCTRRTPTTDMETVRGRVNVSMRYLKEHFPEQQIILMTPIHRAFATFSETNVQPEECFANQRGLFIESYVEIIREAADLWSCPLIDLFRDSGLYPLCPSFSGYFHDAKTDLLHPNAAGHKRIAETIIARLNALPPSFRK